MNVIIVLSLVATAASASTPGSCHGLVPPPVERVVREFAPVGRWAGHWGVDIASPHSAHVLAIGAGVVSFAGEVVGRAAVTVDHGGGLRSTYSALASIGVGRGERITAGQLVGRSGLHDGGHRFHLSLRVAGAYVDPMLLRRCAATPARALFLAPAGVL